MRCTRALSNILMGLWLLCSCVCVAAEPLIAPALLGDPPVVEHQPDAVFDTTHLAVAQDPSGMVYLASVEGVLTFDGERWNRVVLSNQDMARSLAVDAQGRVYVGGYGVFGYLERAATGVLRFVDLTPRVTEAMAGRELADIWEIVVSPEGVYFTAVRDVFLFEPESGVVRHWHHPGRFGAIARHAGRTLLQFRGEGFRTRQGDGWVALPETAALVDLVFELLPLADGSTLSMGADGRWWRWRDGVLVAQDMPVGLPASSNFEHGLSLPDGSLALAGADGAVYLLDPELRNWRRLQLAAGFLSGVTAAVGGGFLVAADQAVYFVSWPSAWTVLGAELGTQGDLAAVVRWRGADYVLGSAGVSRVQQNAGGAMRLETLDWKLQAAFALFPLDGDRALLADNHKVLLMEGQDLRPLSEELVYPREFFPSRFRPGRVYLATEVGLRFIEPRADGTLQLSPEFPDPREIRVTGVRELSANELWFGSDRHGLWRVQLDASGAIASATTVSPGGQPTSGPLAEARVAQLADGVLRVSTPAGLFKLEGSELRRDDLLGHASLGGPSGVLQLVEASDASIWAYGQAGVFRRSASADWVEQPLQRLRRGSLVGHRLEPDGGITLVSSRVLLIHQNNVTAAAAAVAPRVQLRALTQVLPDGRRLPLPLHTADPALQLAQADYGLSFQFALPELSVSAGSLYQGRLLGYEEQWSEWSRTHSYTYSRLDAGTYVLEVRARDAAGRVSSITPFRIMIVPPWYRTWWAMAMAGVLTVLLIGWLVRSFVRLRLARLDEDKQQLAALVAEQTRDLASANLRLQKIALLDGLTGIANRRRLDHDLRLLWDQARQSGQPLALLAIDVDHFKQYNDSHGHLAGDELLKSLAQVLSANLRSPSDLLARFGGEEFMVVMPDLDLVAACLQAERLRQCVDQADLGATVSIGCASTRPQHADPSTLLAAADQALYAAKRAGRNRIEPDVRQE